MGILDDRDDYRYGRSRKRSRRNQYEDDRGQQRSVHVTVNLGEERRVETTNATIHKGELVFCIVLWFCILVPGFLYTWYLLARNKRWTGHGEMPSITKGELVGCIVLWFCFFAPGILYTLYLLSRSSRR